MTSSGFLAIGILAGLAAIYKLLTSGRGRVSIPGISISWGR